MTDTPVRRRSGRWLRRALGDTLARRIFLTLWITLVVAQIIAVGTLQWLRGPELPFVSVPAVPTLPPLPPLPPISGFGGGPADSPADLHDPEHDLMLPGDPPRFMTAPRSMPPRLPMPLRGLSTRELLLDFGIRLLVTGLAAWLASRWLARPMRQLVAASRALGQSLQQSGPLPLLDEQRGTLEVRETAQVFNTMARQLRRQFNERGLMVAAISHDLRTPLTRLRMRLETLELEELQRQKSVDDIREMNALVDAVMDLFRAEAPGTLEATRDLDLGALAQAVTDDLLEQGLPVSVDQDDKAVIARGQPLALRRVLGNLVGNALRYGERADVSVGRDGSGAWVRVRDAGPGIPAERLEAVFEAFYRLEDSRNRHTGGTGLGLYIARELMRRQGGELTLSNLPEGGLMAEIRLP